MFMDADLLFSDAQAVTAAAASTNYYDTGPLFTGNTGRNIGMSTEIYFSITVDTAFTDSGSNSTLTVDLQTDDNTSFTSQATVATLVTIPAVTAAGTKYFVKVPVATTVPYERYIRIYYTPNTGDLSAGAVTVAIVKNPDNWTSYVSAVSTGI
jgi:hypothetical protein